MLTTIGRRSKSAEDLVDHLLECHGRIRSFLGLAQAIAERADASPTEVAEACARCERYFVEALPLHVQDEELSILPRLRGSAELAHALESMARQHAEHELLVGGLLAALGQVAAKPERLALRQALARAAAQLASAFEPHLELEESIIFPALRARLDPEDRERIRLEMRLRRGQG